MKTDRAMFGISVFKRSITNRVIANIAKFIDDKYEECMIIIVDQPEVHNWLLRGRESEKHAMEVVERTAENRTNAIKRVLRQNDKTIPIKRWYSISKDRQYLQNLAILREYYSTNQAFRKDVLSQLHEYLGDQIRQSIDRLGRALAQKELDESAQFLLEEIAGLSYLHFDRGFNVDVYPEEQGEVTRALFTGRKYDELRAKLKVDPASYQYIIYQ